MSAGLDDIFLAKFNTFGAHLWSKRFGGGNQDYGRAVAVDSKGNVLLTGDFSGPVDFGFGNLSAGGDLDIFLLKIAP